jgi:hypothetical protein
MTAFATSRMRPPAIAATGRRVPPIISATKPLGPPAATTDGTSGTNTRATFIRSFPKVMRVTWRRRRDSRLKLSGRRTATWTALWDTPSTQSDSSGPRFRERTAWPTKRSMMPCVSPSLWRCSESSGRKSVAGGASERGPYRTSCGRVSAGSRSRVAGARVSALRETDPESRICVWIRACCGCESIDTAGVGFEPTGRLHAQRFSRQGRNGLARGFRLSARQFARQSRAGGLGSRGCDPDRG